MSHPTWAGVRAVMIVALALPVACTTQEKTPENADHPSGFAHAPETPGAIQLPFLSHAFHKTTTLYPYGEAIVEWDTLRITVMANPSETAPDGTQYDFMDALKISYKDLILRESRVWWLKDSEAAMELGRSERALVYGPTSTNQKESVLQEVGITRNGLMVVLACRLAKEGALKTDLKIWQIRQNAVVWSRRLTFTVPDGDTYVIRKREV